MSDFHLKGFDKINANKELIDRTKRKLTEPTTRIKRNRFPKILAVAVSLCLLFISYQLLDLRDGTSNNNGGIVTTEDGALHIPAIKLPKESNANMDMIGLIVYKGKIYTQTSAHLDTNRINDLLGEKLGTTKPTIDEWSTQDEYAEEFASSIGSQDVYSVNGYDEDFRIMSYSKYEGEVYAEFYECLNGITINDGEDLFAKLKLTDRMEEATYQSYNDWYYSVNNHHSFENINLLNTFTEKLNRATPYTYETVNEEVGEYNDENFRKLTIHLEDGTSVDLTVFKDGYVSYGYAGIFFKMDDPIFQEVWQELSL